MRHPSIKTLQKTFGDKALMLRKIIDGRQDCWDWEKLPHTTSWKIACYNSPDNIEARLRAMEEVLEGFGIECIRAGESSDNEIVASYINMGDTYNATILYNHHNERFEVTSWGDWVEWAERKKIIQEEG